MTSFEGRASMVLVVVLPAMLGCDLARETVSDAILADADYGEPRTDLVPAVGSDATLDLATWNLEFFPAVSSTPRVVADLVTSLGLDVVVTEEIADVDGWAELVARLHGWTAVLSTHRYANGTYQKVGVLARTAEVTLGEATLLFERDGAAFPRPALSVPIVDVATGRTIEVIGIHLKAGVEADDAARRADAIEAIDAHVQAQIAAAGEPDVIIAGDYNEVVDDAAGQVVLAPLLDHPERYTVHSEALGLAGGVSFLPASVMLDQITSTVALADALGAATVVVPPLDEQYPGYEAEISDHLPVVLVAPR